MNLDRDAVEFVTIDVSSGGPAFDAASLELAVGRGEWEPVEVVTAQSGGTAVVRYLFDATAKGAGVHRLRLRLVDDPETVVIAAGSVTVT